jgi:hypothetical protein
MIRLMEPICSAATLAWLLGFLYPGYLEERGRRVQVQARRNFGRYSRG